MKGLVLTSGGVKCAFQIGVIKALKKIGITFDIGAGASGGVPVLFGYFNQQLEELEDIWRNEVTSKKFISMRRYFSKHPIMNVDYLIYSVIRRVLTFKNDEMDLEKKIIFPLYNATKRQTHYQIFTKGSKKETLDLIYAAVSAPFLSDRMKRIKGHTYYDGAFDDPIPWEQTVKHGSKNIVVIGTRQPRAKDFPLWFIRMFFRPHKNPRVERARQRVLSKFHVHDIKLNSLANNPQDNITLITPDKSRFRYHLVNNSREVMGDLIDHGYDKIMKNPTLIKKLTSQFT